MRELAHTQTGEFHIHTLKQVFEVDSSRDCEIISRAEGHERRNRGPFESPDAGSDQGGKREAFDSTNSKQLYTLTSAVLVNLFGQIVMYLRIVIKHFQIGILQKL